MAVLPILRLGHPALRTPAEPVALDRIAEADFQRLIDDLIETMGAADGVGLAAPQVGVSEQLFVYEVADPTSTESAIPLRVVVNPMVEPVAGALIQDWEGCLSIPDLRGLVPRHPEVRVHGLDRGGRRVDYEASGYEARIVQHEFDHLNAIVFLDRMRDLQSLAFYEEWESFLSEGGLPGRGVRPG